MELAFRTQYDSTQWAFTLHFEPQEFAAYTHGGSPRLAVQAFFRRSHSDGAPTPSLFPVLIDLHGALVRQNGGADVGMPLLPVKDLPVSLLPSSGNTLVNLTFEVKKEYLHLLEEERARTPGQGVVLTLNLWAMAAMVRPASEERPSLSPRIVSGDVVRFERCETEPSLSSSIRFERSAWIDRILPGLGYQQSLLIEIPLIQTPPLPQIYQQAASALEQARKAFLHEDYRAAIKYGREVLEQLGALSSDSNKQLTSFCKEYLEPSVGETKTLAVDTALASVRRITNAGSHANAFAADRATAAFVLEQLALTLRYIAALLG